MLGMNGISSVRIFPWGLEITPLFINLNNSLAMYGMRG